MHPLGSHADHSFGAFLCLVLAATTGCRGVSSPEAPDLSATVTAYDAPTTALDTEVARELATQGLQDASLVEDLDELSFVAASLDSLELADVPGADAGGGSSGGDSEGIVIGDRVLTGNGFLTLTYRCDGWAGDPGGGTGDMRLNALLVDTQVQEVLWGEMSPRARAASGRDRPPGGHVHGCGGAGTPPWRVGSEESG